MFLHFQRYATAAVLLWSMFGAYALLAVPLLEPALKLRDASGRERAPGDATASLLAQHRTQLQHFFPPGSWQLGAPKVLATEYGTLLFEDYQPLADGRMELKPLTVVAYAQRAPLGSNAEQGRPLILSAPDGAILQFDSSTDPSRADFGRLLGGLLAGEIEIRSPASSPAANDALLITTRHVQLDERRIWTPHPVHFRYGSSHGSGRDLSIALLPADKTVARRDAPAVAGVKSVELVHVDKFHLELPGATLLPGAAPPEPDPARKPRPPAPIEISCRGPLLLDVPQRILSFEDTVDVIRLNPDGPSDQLNCELLAIHLTAPAAATSDDPLAGLSPADLEEHAASDQAKLLKSASLKLAAERVVAVGHPVVLRAPSVGATARGERFEYHLAKRRILLADSQKVTLVDDRFDVEARELEYELAPAGGLGRVWAAGPGRMRAKRADLAERKPKGASRLQPPVTPIGGSGASPKTPPQFEATWKKELWLRPQHGQHVVSLLDDARVHVTPLGGFSAAEIHLWLNETAPATPRARAAAPGTPKMNVEPDRLLALGNVKVDATQLHGETGRLEVWFQNTGAPATSAPGAAQPAATSRASPAAANDPDKPALPATRFALGGDVIRIQLLRHLTAISLSEVSVDGHVSLVQEPSAGAPMNEIPLAIRGQSLRLQGGIGPETVVRVFGKPAEISGRGMVLHGGNVQLHRGDNRIWIEGPGHMALPVASDLSGQKLARPANIDIDWQQGLEFDGSLAQFQGNVQARTAQQWARADRLLVTLAKRVDFAAASPSTKPEVEAVEFQGHFALENRTFDKQGRALSLDKLQAHTLRIEQQSGRMEAQGPGWVSTIRVGGAQDPLAARLAPAGREPAERQPQPGADNDDALGYTYLFVEFQAEIAGNFFAREVEFHKHVRAVYGPVASWESQLDIDRPERLPPAGVLMQCQRLALRQMPGTQRDTTRLEMEALQDVIVEGRGFTARSGRMTYEDEKQLLVLEADGRRDAELTRQTSPGAPQSSLKARKIRYWHFDNRVEFDDVRMLELNQIGELKK